MAKIKIDGTEFEVKTDRNLLETCLSLGFDIPYFCNHPALGSVGACRQCAVKKYAHADDKKGKIVMSCMEPVSDGLIISIDDPEVKAFRAAIIESLMTNHPHDCPICDEGGECHLQDMTVMTGHDYRRFIFKKRTHYNQDLGPFIQHEMNRCIQCYRCVRFYRDYAGGKDFNVFGSARQVFFGRTKDGTLENEFSGNLVEVCPTGVFTDKTHKKHFTRKWDLTNSPSICVHCSVGCNIIVSERYGMVRRIMSRYNGSVNGYFICDRGRFGYEFVNNPSRVRQIGIRSDKDKDLQYVNSLTETGMTDILKTGRIIGIGSPRASLESNFALSALVGKNNFFHGISGNEHRLIKKALQITGSDFVHNASLKEVEKCDAVLILGEDVTNTAPMLALAIRQASRNKSLEIAAKLGIPKWNDSPAREMDQDQKSPLFIASPITTKLDELAEYVYQAAPADIAAFGFAIAASINSDAPAVNLNEKNLQENVSRIARSLSAAKNPLIIAGTSLGNEDILNAVSNIAQALSISGIKPSIAVAFPECNSAGLVMMDGHSLDEALGTIANDSPDAIIILENDLFRRIPGEKLISAFAKCKRVIVLDHLMNPTARKADILLPAATFAESDGTIVSNERRAQRFYQVLPEKEPIEQSWRWISDMMKLSGKNGWEKFDDVVSSMVSSYPFLSGIKDQLPDAGFRFYNEKIARQNKRFSGRTAIDASISVSEPKPPQDVDTPLDFSMEGYKGIPPSTVTPYYWSPGWNSYQSVTKYMDEQEGHLKEGGDPGIMLSNNDQQISGYIKDLPEPFKIREAELFIFPLIRALGSEELSSKSESVEKVISEAFIILNEREISRFYLTISGKSKFIINQLVIEVIVKKNNALPDGVAGLFLSGTEAAFELPGWGKVLKI